MISSVNTVVCAANAVTKASRNQFSIDSIKANEVSNTVRVIATFAFTALQWIEKSWLSIDAKLDQIGRSDNISRCGRKR